MSLKFGLIEEIIKHVDPHLAIVLLEFYETKEEKVFEPETIRVHKLLVLIKTKIIEYINTECDKINIPQTNKIKEEFEKIKEITEHKAGEYLNSSQNFLDLYEAKFEDLKKERFSKSAYSKIKEFESFSKSDFNNTAKLARCLFDIGQYAESLSYLNAIQNLIEDDETHLSVLWGKTLANIILKSFDEAKEDFKVLKLKIDTFSFKINMQILANRTFMLNTALFLYLINDSNENDLETLIELYTNEHNLNTIQMTSPHLIRYLAASLLLSKNACKYGAFNLMSFVNMLQKETCEYSDPLIEFIKQTLINYDFKAARNLYKQIKDDLKHDFFLGSRTDAILNAAMTVLFEEYCKINSFIEIGLVAEYLEIPKDEAEIWIVNLIRNALIDAKIDSEKDVIIISREKSNFYEDFFTKTRDLIPKTNLLVNNIKRIFVTKA